MSPIKPRRGSSRKFRFPTRAEWIFLLIAFVSSFVIFYIHIRSSQNRIPNYQNETADIVFGIRVKELDKNEINKFNQKETPDIPLESWEIEYAQIFDTPLVLMSIDYIYVAEKFLVSNSGNQICIVKIEIRTNNDVGMPQSFIRENLCNGRGVNYFVNQSTNFAVLLYDKYNGEYSDPYYFPFDSRSISAELTIDAILLDADGKELSVFTRPTIQINVISQNGKDYWNFENHKNDNNIKLTLHRPLMYPILSVLLLVVIFVAILSLLLLVDDKNEKNDDAAEAGYWEVAVGILGIWSIQEVLLPDFIEGPTIIGDIILALYIFLSLVILYIFVRSADKNLKDKKGNNQSHKKT